jgi:hypothetical protein
MSQLKSWRSVYNITNWAEACEDRGRKKTTAVSFSKKNLMEHLGFLAKLKSSGNLSFIIPSDQTSCHSITELPFEGTHLIRFLKSSVNLRRSFHQKDPVGLLACGGM